MSPTAEPAGRPALAAAIIGGVVLVALAFTVLAVADSSYDGASEPDDAVTAYLDALGTDDLAALLDQLPPAERAAVADGLAALAPELERLGLAQDLVVPVGVDRTLEGVHGPGFELDIAETGRTTTAFEQWIARAEPEGSAGPSGPPRDDLAARLAAQVLGLDDVGLDRARLRTQVLPPSLVVVRHGGGWHVSPQYSAWETWRLANGIELPNFAEGPRAIGADTADAVVADLFGALERRDPGRIQSMVEPHENGALYHYVDLVLPTIEGAWSLIGTDPEAGALVVEHLATEVEVPDPADGSRRRLVRITELAGTYTEGGRMLAFEYRDGCLEISEPSTGATTRRCDGDLDPTPLTDTGLDALFAWTPLGRTFPTFAVSEDRGRWFLSPIRTELFTLAEVLAGLEPEDLDQLELALRAYEERRDGAPTWPELSVLLGLDRPPRSRTQGSNLVDTAGGAPVGDPEVDQPDQPGG